MITRIFHCDRDRELATVIAETEILPRGWRRIHVVESAGGEGGYVWYFCPRCCAALDALLVSFDVRLGPPPQRAP